MGNEKKKKPVHKDFKEHSFDSFIDMVDKGEEVHKIYECECGARMIEVYTQTNEKYERCEGSK